MELLAEGQHLEEELRQIVDYTQGSSLARFRISNTRHTGCDVDVCMMYPVITLLEKKTISAEELQSHTFSVSCLSFSLIFFLFILIICPISFFPSRRLSSFVWRGCRLMNSYVRSPRVTDPLTGREEREGKEEEGIIQMAVRMPPPPLYMAVAPITVEGVGAEATATALDMVGTFKIKKSEIKQCTS